MKHDQAKKYLADLPNTYFWSWIITQEENSGYFIKVDENDKKSGSSKFQPQ